MTEAVAQDTMMQAHTYGFAVAGEWGENTWVFFRFSNIETLLLLFYFKCDLSVNVNICIQMF